MEISTECEQYIAIVHRIMAACEADQASHVDIVGIVPLGMLLAFARMPIGDLSLSTKISGIRRLET
jgi:hypothetical protein